MLFIIYRYSTDVHFLRMSLSGWSKFIGINSNSCLIQNLPRLIFHFQINTHKLFLPSPSLHFHPCPQNSLLQQHYFLMIFTFLTLPLSAWKGFSTGNEPGWGHRKDMVEKMSIPNHISSLKSSPTDLWGLAECKGTELCFRFTCRDKGDGSSL